jgi:PTH1 family peptidyl-tRNA hydrolase
MNALMKLVGSKLPFQVDWLIVGLGNPGVQYAETPHNIGFQVLDAFAKAHNASFKVEKKALAEVAVITINQQRLLLLKPLTYMNLSGQCVEPFRQLYQLPVERCLVIVDEINLPFGSIRIRAKGSAGGQNGMKHLLQCFGQNQNFPRIRLGIGPQPNGTALEDYVLAPYNSQQQTQLPELLSRAVQSIDVFLTQGLTVAQNYCNT